MNEGESAGGGHQGSNSAPPAVSDRRSIISTATTANTIIPTVNANSNTGSNSSINHSTPSILTIVTTNNQSTTLSNTFSTTAAATIGTNQPRSFQQVFTQQHIQLQQQKIQQAQPSLVVATAGTAASTTSQQPPHMPQTPSRFKASATVAGSQTQSQNQLLNPANSGVGGGEGASSSSSSSYTPPASNTVRTFVSSINTVSDLQPLTKRSKITGSSHESSVVIGSGGNIAGSLLPANSGVAQESKYTPSVSTPQDLNALKKRILEQKYLRLRSLKEKHSENVAELFYIQSGGNMMDYPTWRKKPPTPQFITFNNAYRLDQLVQEERAAAAAAAAAAAQQQQQQHQTADNTIASGSSNTNNNNNNSQQQLENNAAIKNITTNPQTQLTPIDSSGTGTTGNSSSSTIRNVSNNSAPVAAGVVTPVTASGGSSIASASVVAAVTSATDSSGNVLPQGAEIKIPAVGATPVAVSTKLPAAVVQLSQQGHIPGRPLGGRHGMVFGQIHASPAVGNTSSVPLVPGGTPLVPCSTASGSTTLRRNGNGVSQISTASSPQSATAQGSASAAASIIASTNSSSSPSYTTGSSLLVPAANKSATTSAAACASSSTAAGNSLVPALGNCSSSSTGGGSSNSALEFSFKAKQEVYVMQRISELQREGLWTEKRLPKLQEPNRPKAHWDYLLEEMVWLAADFAQERKWKKNAAKKCAKMVQKYFQDKANAAQKAEKAQEAHLKRIAAFISKEVKMFWSNVEKLVEYKHHTKLEEKRKKALDQHLSFIVDQTEKFSQQLAEGMNKTAVDAIAASAVSSMNSSRISSPKRKSGDADGADVNMSDDDFRPESASEDDEETIAKAEEEAADVKEEVAALAKESQMDLDEFINDLPPGYLENRDKLLLEEAEGKSSSSVVHDDDDDDDDDDGDDTDDVEFEANEASEDDENTISKQEEQEMDVDHKKELDELQADNDLTVEQLLKKYKAPPSSSSTSEKPGKMNIDSDDDEEEAAESVEQAGDDDAEEETVVSDDNDASVVANENATIDSDDDDDENGTNDEDDDDDEASSETDENEQEEDEKDGLKTLIEDTDANANSKDDMIKDAAALAESLQPKGNTLSSTNVVTPVPFLLKHSLREYQHIGLDWLVTMNERKLNGILADEMGLGKTIQTIALLAHLACVKGNWGPHLIVVPSSVMLNWEMEFKKWCPGFKILTYYGTQKERKMKRVGWTKPNAFHVCITSYKLVVQDQQSFRRKKWKYLILDEAQNIKNFKSQRWQLLLNFSTERRLLLTGTPLQNDLMELWSLMHFLMPYVFSSHREFKEWFSNPMTGMIEGNMEYNETLITRLHKVIRPFLLRRLKKEVEKQMPKKYEHVVMCRLSNRQRYLYDDFMSRAKTKETLQAGNLLSVISVLMQLRKVCNHPNMFEVRPTISPFQMEGISFQTAGLVSDLMEYDPFTQIDLHSLNLILMQLELTLTAYVSYKSRVLAPARKLIEEIDTLPKPPPPCPTGKYKFYVRVRDQRVQQNLSTHSVNAVRVGASPAMKTEGNKLVPVCNVDPTKSRIGKRINNMINPVYAPKVGPIVATAIAPVSSTGSGASTNNLAAVGGGKVAKLIQGGKPYYFVTNTSTSSTTMSNTTTSGGSRVTIVCKTSSDDGGGAKTSSSTATTSKPDMENAALLQTLAQQVKTTANATPTTTAAATTKATSETMDVDEDDNGNNENSQQSPKSKLPSENGELDPVFNMSEILQQRKEKRLARLRLMAGINKRRVEAVPIYGEDCRDSLKKLVGPSELLEYSSWQTRGYSNCRAAMMRHDSWTLNTILKSYERRVADLRQVFANFVIYVPSACAPRIRFHAQHLAAMRVRREQEIEQAMTQVMSPKLALLHPIASAMSTQFPDPRLIQYDCGKLQTLDRLLRQLKSEQHRVLIFTQMTKMLDVLEAFLNYHGHIYLRLDGSTRVEQRQVLMERFNGDKRIFCFILSTRSGGVGVNLTGADTVIFYDSDWNPTMDAQAQDRCHRIGQTRDVHIYRLVSEKTIEVNILKKANQKRMLSDMAIEGGNFTTSYLKSSTIKDLFNLEQPEQEFDVTTSAVTLPTTTTATVSSSAIVSRQENPTTSANAANETINNEVQDSEKQSLRAFESALAAAEDEQDVQATRIAKAEAAADLAEFDENIPIDETTGDGTNGPTAAAAPAAAAATEMSKADLEMYNLVKQLSPIERYAMRFVEETGAAWTAEQLRAAEEEIEAQKREWEANRLAALQKEEEMLMQESRIDEILTYHRKDATNQIWISNNTKELMPMWCPPTPPQDDNDVYIDYSLSFMYEMDSMPESQLPPVYVKKEYKRSRSDAGFLLDGVGNRRPPKIRREDTVFAPRSLFDRPSAAIARIRRDLKNQRYRGVFKPNVQIPGLKPQIPQKPLTEPEGMAEWSIFEDIAILHVLVNLQGLPCNLMVLSPGHTPNWDLVAEIVNTCSKTFRSPKQCRWRYEAVIQPREEGKLVESPKKPKKLKGSMKSEYLKGSLRYLRTTQLYSSDNNTTFTKLMRSRFDCIKTCYLKKAPPPKRHFSTPNLMNPKHMEVLQEFGVVNYDQPISPMNIALMKANKMREKQRSQLPPPPPPSNVVAGAANSGVQQSTVVAAQQPHLQQQQQHQQQQQIQEIVQQNVTVSASPQSINAASATSSLHTQQLQIQHISTSGGGSVTQQPTAIVLQHSSGLSQSHQHPQATGAQAQTQIMRNHPQTTTQIVKAIVAPQSTLLTAGQMQQLTQQAAATGGTQHVQLQQSVGSGGLVGTPSSVSVVLTTPVQTLSSTVQQAQQHSAAVAAGGGTQGSTAQIVSISPQTIVSSSTQVGSIVQTIPSQSLPQVVSVSQLATVGTVLTTSANLQSNATVTPLNTSSLRAQRIVAAASGSTLQDVVLQQRTGVGNQQGSTIVSMSSIGQSVTPAQFQAAQLRIANMPVAGGNAQQVKGIPVSSLQQSGKISSTTGGGNQPAHIQLYRQRQQLKVLQATSAQTGGNQTVVQTASGQTTLVNAAGTIIQGSLMQSTGGGGIITTGNTTMQGQKVSVATVASSNVATPSSGGVVTSVATVQMAHNQGRAQFIKQVAGKQTIARQVGDSDMLLVKRQVIGAHQKAQLIQQGGQIFTTTSSSQAASVQLQQHVQAQQAAGSVQQQTQTQAQTQQVTPQQIATLVRTSVGTVATGSSSSNVGVTLQPGQAQQGTVNMALSHLKPGGQIKVTMANQSQMRQLHMQQHLAMPRKINRMTQIATAQANAASVVGGNVAAQQQSGGTIGAQQQGGAGTTIATQKPTSSGGIQTQLVHIQSNTKTLPSSVTVQQIQQVMRQGQSGTLAATGLVLGKTSVGRVIPVSVAASQANQRQTIQVVSAASAQALAAAGNIRAHVAGGQNITGTIKVSAAGGGGQSQTTQQALITAIQQQAAAHQSQRQNASPVRLQTTAGGNLVAVVQQQALQQQQQSVVSSGIAVSNSGGSITTVGGQNDVMTITQTVGGGASTSTSIVGSSQQQQQMQQQQQHTTSQTQQATPQQVRTLVKKKIMQIRSTTAATTTEKD